MGGVEGADGLESVTPIRLEETSAGSQVDQTRLQDSARMLCREKPGAGRFAPEHRVRHLCDSGFKQCGAHPGKYGNF